jgi:hypothetical protein
MRWATRRHCHVDRAACAWLIRRFLDPEAELVLVDDPDEVPADATPFDMRGVELSHHGGDCSFETFLHRYELADPVLWEIAKVVHEADLADERYDAPEAPGLDVLLRGLSIGARRRAAARPCRSLVRRPVQVPQTRTAARTRARLTTLTE